MHPLIGSLILLGAAAFIGFAFRQGMGVRRDHQRDDGAAMNMGGSDSGPSHHPGDGSGHGF
jgi:hypothetical protein